jgi:hypothetical protein
MSTRNGTSWSGHSRVSEKGRCVVGNCAGVDWATEKHDLLIEDVAGRELSVGTFTHDESGVSALCKTLVRFEVEVVAIERPDGVLVERMLEMGVKVLALHPNQVKAARDRFRAGKVAKERIGTNAGTRSAATATARSRLRRLRPTQSRSAPAGSGGTREDLDDPIDEPLGARIDRVQIPCFGVGEIGVG